VAIPLYPSIEIDGRTLYRLGVPIAQQARDLRRFTPRQAELTPTLRRTQLAHALVGKSRSRGPQIAARQNVR
jgi:hypothetical protein